MVAAIALRDDYDGARLRALAKASQDANQTRRLLCLAVIYEGGRRSEAAALGGVGLQIIRDWALRFNAEGPAGLIDRKPPGASPKLNQAQRRALAALIDVTVVEPPIMVELEPNHRRQVYASCIKALEDMIQGLPPRPRK